jgi:DNA-binding GntR family transcriptional regulator
MILKMKGPVARKSLADSVYEAVLENILSGELAAGSEVSEVGLAEALQVSRTPAHEAVGRLLKDGLLVQEPPRRLVVARFSREDAVEIYEMRQLLETAAARSAARLIDDATLAQLRAEADALDRDRGAPDWTSRTLDFDLRFHDAIAQASGNRRLQADISRYRLLVRAFCRMTGSPENLADALGEHRQILAALEARDPGRAARAAAIHVDNRYKVVLKRLFPEGA